MQKWYTFLAFSLGDFLHTSLTFFTDMNIRKKNNTKNVNNSSNSFYVLIF